MFDYDALYKVLDSHFVNHLARPGEEELAGEDTVEADGGELAPVDLPDNMLEDVLDELDGALEELHDEYGYSLEELTAAAIGCTTTSPALISVASLVVSASSRTSSASGR